MLHALLDNAVDPTAHAAIDHVAVANFLIAFILPIAVGLVTKVNTSSQTQALLHLALSAATGFITEMAKDGAFRWQQALLNSVMVFVVGVAAHFGVWRPTGTSVKAQAMFGGNK